MRSGAAAAWADRAAHRVRKARRSVVSMCAGVCAIDLCGAMSTTGSYDCSTPAVTTGRAEVAAGSWVTCRTGK